MRILLKILTNWRAKWFFQYIIAKNFGEKKNLSNRYVFFPILVCSELACQDQVWRKEKKKYCFQPGNTHSIKNKIPEHTIYSRSKIQEAIDWMFSLEIESNYLSQVLDNDITTWKIIWVHAITKKTEDKTWNLPTLNVINNKTYWSSSF